MAKFGAIIRGLRMSHHLTLDQMAKKIGTHKGYICGIESGKVAPPSMKFIPKIAKLLGASVETLALHAYVEKAPKIIRETIVKALQEKGHDVA